MQFDKWFNKQTQLAKIILLLIPFVGWIVEILVRLSVALRTKEVVHIVMFLVFAIFGMVWIPCVIDFIYLILKDRLFLTD